MGKSHGKEDPERLKIDLEDIHTINHLKLYRKLQVKKNIKFLWMELNIKMLIKLMMEKVEKLEKGNLILLMPNLLDCIPMFKTWSIFISLYILEVMGIKKAKTLILRNGNKQIKYLHKVKCNGCGIYPIIGCRFKSQFVKVLIIVKIVKANYQKGIIIFFLIFMNLNDTYFP